MLIIGAAGEPGRATSALELAGHGITANAVAPGEGATPMTGSHLTTDEWRAG